MTFLRPINLEITNFSFLQSVTSRLKCEYATAGSEKCKTRVLEIILKPFFTEFFKRKTAVKRFRPLVTSIL